MTPNTRAGDPTGLPMAGVTVLDLTQVYNGPYATFLMAMAGAEVIKIEPPGGEHLRRRNARSGAGVPFAMLNANKRSISLNLKDKRGRDLFLELARTADVVVENFTPGVMARLGIDYPTLKTINPQIIVASSSGYGRSGEYSLMPAMDLTVQAMSGVLSITGFYDAPPVKAGAAVCDFMAGVHLYGGIAAALFGRERNAVGSHVEVAMIDAIYPSLASNIGSLYSERTDIPSRTGNRHGGLSLSPYSVYPTQDGFMAIVCSNDKHWLSLLKAMDRDDLVGDPRYATMSDRVARMDEVDALVSGWISGLDRTAATAKLTEFHVPSAPVRDLREVIGDPDMHRRGMLSDIVHPDFGAITVCRSPINIQDVPQPAYSVSPRLGNDTFDILSTRLGLSQGSIDVLTKAGVI